MFHNVVDTLRGRSCGGSDATVKVPATVVLMKKNVLSLQGLHDTVLDGVHEIVGKGISFQLVSATVPESNGKGGKIGPPAYLREWYKSLTSLTAGESKFHVHFEWSASQGAPGALIVKNFHHSEFFLKTVTLDGLPAAVAGKSRIQFVCNSWVYPAKKYTHDRIFFANDTYLPNQMPELLKKYREDELSHLRGDNITGKLKEYHRVYAYDYYNDLGRPDDGPDFVRPILGGTQEYPYPRRGRTGRPPSSRDVRTESRLPDSKLDIYVPRDERFGHVKMSDFLAYQIKALAHGLIPTLKTTFSLTPMEFDNFEDVEKLYDGSFRLPKCFQINELCKKIPFEMLRELIRTDGEGMFKLPTPQVIEVDKQAWKKDEEFARQMLAGANPLVIRLLEEFPPASKLDVNLYGDHTSSITEAHILNDLEGRTVDEALLEKRLFILDYHDALIPYLHRINSGSNKVYATRTVLFLKRDGTLKPLAIELSLPEDAEQSGAINRVFTPAPSGVQSYMWQLAKAYVATNDCGYHQLICHWLNTHAIMEPFVIATNRQLSVVHPIHKLLSPHYRDTMNINALARQTLINADGVIESTVFPGKYAMEMSAAVYKDWKLTEQGLPDDLRKRGIAAEDPTSPNNLRLLIEDYPFAVDGLDIWSAIESWVTEYCGIYYPDDATIQEDVELQAWWKEVREVGHGDKTNEDWWPTMQTVAELTKTCTTLIWVASALHAAVNFGQHAYAGYLPNRPTITRRWMPEEDTADYEKLKKNPDRFFLNTVTSHYQTVLAVTLMSILSKHSSDEVYLGQRDTTEWTTDGKALQAFKRFRQKLIEIEKQIEIRNKDPTLKNRNGLANIPYTLLYPDTSQPSPGGITGRGIPNSVSI